MNQTEYVEYIAHEGIITKVNVQEGWVNVKLTDADDCGACPAAVVCTLSGKDDKETLRIWTAAASKYKVGERVEVRGSERMHRKAIMLATVIPCVVLLGVMILIWMTTGSEAVAALGGIGAMIFFFTLLWICRDKVRHEFVFELSRK